MLQWLVEIQRDIYLTFAGYIKASAAGGGWTVLAAFLPMGIVFGAVHAMTPGSIGLSAVRLIDRNDFDHAISGLPRRRTSVFNWSSHGWRSVKMKMRCAKR
jgi:hypothetical protein